MTAVTNPQLTITNINQDIDDSSKSDIEKSSAVFQ